MDDVSSCVATKSVRVVSVKRSVVRVKAETVRGAVVIVLAAAIAIAVHAPVAVVRPRVVVRARPLQRAGRRESASDLGRIFLERSIRLGSKSFVA